ncbi:tubulin binding cofactor [Tritrichomonas foetus]|uniref:Tubulin-specific chaperone A n=1 Tax=Tritrichomonas foetus TaxID=1144522 RepID=A0A1J4KTX1_9EUKA|nr:tubulin binding cofactor [Tritrichomonas foetus]|eukprot:OHT13110.1 tubulin binding cofactor [Tritrichomonas foetus]
MNPQQQKTLRIQVGAVTRLKKEVGIYEQELQEAQDKVSSATYEPGSYEMKHLNDLRDEADATLKDVVRRLEDFKKKLRAALKDVETQFPDDELVIEAKRLLA